MVLPYVAEENHDEDPEVQVKPDKDTAADQAVKDAIYTSRAKVRAFAKLCPAIGITSAPLDYLSESWAHGQCGCSTCRKQHHSGNHSSENTASMLAPVNLVSTPVDSEAFLYRSTGTREVGNGQMGCCNPHSISAHAKLQATQRYTLVAQAHRFTLCCLSDMSLACASPRVSSLRRKALWASTKREPGYHTGLQLAS